MLFRPSQSTGVNQSRFLRTHAGFKHTVSMQGICRYPEIRALYPSAVRKARLQPLSQLLSYNGLPQATLETHLRCLYRHVIRHGQDSRTKVFQSPLLGCFESSVFLDSIAISKLIINTRSLTRDATLLESAARTTACIGPYTPRVFDRVGVGNASYSKAAASMPLEHRDKQ